MDITKTITHLSLCSGYEGIGLGLRRVFSNLREIAYVEREGFPIANLVAKMEAGELDAAPVFTDVKTFPYTKFRGCVDILSGGFPCQPFSAAGKRQATEDPRHLFPYIADGIRECQPRIVFLENVQGILSCKTGDGEPVLQYVLRELEGMGYRATAGIFSAEEVGAPHQRKRVFILGVRYELGYSDSQRCEGERLRGDEREPEGSLSGRSSQELVNSNSDGYSQHPRTQKEESIGGAEATTMPRGEELGNTQHDGLYGTTESRGTTETVQDNPQGEDSTCQSQRTGSPSELAYSINKGSQGRLHGGQDTQRQGVNGYVGRSCSSSHRGWPARPSEPQYEWEEPRVVVNIASKGLEGGRGPSLQGTDEGLTSTNPSNGQAESRLGRASNGSSSRVDRLRLLGNGVVPATAAKAFVTLIQRLI